MNFYSDQRLKTHITKLDSTLDKVLLLNAYRFEWKAKPNKDDIGLLAQEVERVFPELIIVDSLGYRQVAYHKFIPILLQAIKEQDSIIHLQNTSISKYDKQLKEQEIQLKDVIQRLEKIEKSK
jgi:trimeric autotransporter adhesin